MLFIILHVTKVLNIKNIEETEHIKILFPLTLIESDSYMTKKL